LNILKGRIENKTKEAALAAMFIALFIVTKTFRIQVTSVFALDFAGAILYTASTVVSWPYTLVFTLATLYQGSTIFAILAWFPGLQAAFFISKIVDRKWVKHIPVLGLLVSLPFAAATLHFGGIMDFRVWIAVCSVPSLFTCITVYIGGRLIWRVLEIFQVIE